ncbi:MAG: hypothetical protein IJT08_01905 [Alphaproteobacteria bacterium]|nr:hypothetical protein [Alphaproteobacteria bacterium]
MNGIDEFDMKKFLPIACVLICFATSGFAKLEQLTQATQKISKAASNLANVTSETEGFIKNSGSLFKNMKKSTLAQKNNVAERLFSKHLFDEKSEMNSKLNEQKLALELLKQKQAKEIAELEKEIKARNEAIEVERVRKEIADKADAYRRKFKLEQSQKFAEEKGKTFDSSKKK